MAASLAAPEPDLTLSRHPARATARRLPPSIDVLGAHGKSTCVKSFSIGIDVSDFQEVAARARPNRIVSQTIVGLGSRKLIIGVDRLDYSKGIRERIEAYERFLVSNPDERGHVTYLQIAD
jgi:trehalose 6-phosphate synthase